ncbi:uncharacterized protein LOC129587292 [Paramacrobiotus metropolitanus]|uniref:uncharacterized protein LOC129587292 n=1 Tax=Paramacrobiotus metropolitanus TaxID=2943436 RepID=UPI0024465D7C|nr:uncharacterized protein LOC129587292 [Paramacrobiotus metropolitanus]
MHLIIIASWLLCAVIGSVWSQGLPTSSGTGMNYGDWMNLASQYAMYKGDTTAFQMNPYLNLYNPYNVQNGLAGINGYPFIAAGSRSNRGPMYNQLSQYGLTFPQLYGIFGTNGYPFYSAQNPVV